ncbi:STAS-like domain-containing protein [Methylomagnum sp.]
MLALIRNGKSKPMSDSNANSGEIVVLTACGGRKTAMARSEAKSVLKLAVEFQAVMFDFSDMEFIGPSFADEIFRVFANEHPGVELVSVNANPDVQKMISRAIHRRHES